MADAVGRFQKQVIVIRHLTPRMHAPVGAAAGAVEDVEPEKAITTFDEDRFAAVPARVTW